MDLDQNIQHTFEALQTRTEFDRARRKAFFGELVSSLRNQPVGLLSFGDVQQALLIRGQSYIGVRQVPVSAIVGSVDRYADFDRQFLPIQTHTRSRWESIAIANLTDVVLPPVQLYKVGHAYFVKDGNHRVSVARQNRIDYIDAEVTEMSVPVDLPLTLDSQDLIRLGEYARFLQQTGLAQLRLDVHFDFTSLGRYDVLLEHISAHGWYMGIDQKRHVRWKEAVLDWYDKVYLPVVQAIRSNRVLQYFPGKTESDLYLWVMDHRWYLREESGQDIGPDAGVLSYRARYGGYLKWFYRAWGFLSKVGATFSRRGREPNATTFQTEANGPQGRLLA